MMILTEMGERHVSQVAELEKLCFHDPWSEKSIAGELNNLLSLWVVAVVDDRVVGYVGSQTVCGESDMMNIAVHPDYRRRGIARSLVEYLIRELANRGSRCLTLEVRFTNESAKALYEMLGFQQVGLRKNYYRNPREDALILRKRWEI